MSEWRPDGWENPHLPITYNNTSDIATVFYQPQRQLDYEAGADAILAAFRKHLISASWYNVIQDNECRVFYKSRFDEIVGTSDEEPGEFVKLAREIHDTPAPRGMPTSDARKRIEEAHEQL